MTAPPGPGGAGSSVVPELKAAGVWDTATLVLAFVSRPSGTSCQDGVCLCNRRPNTASATEAREQGGQRAIGSSQDADRERARK